MEIGILATHDLSLFPQETCFALQRLPAPSDQLCITLVGDKPESVYSPPIHVAIRSRNPVTSHDHHHQVQCARFLAEEVVGGVMRGRSLWDLAVWAWLESMNKIGEEDGIVNEEDWSVDANNVFLI